MGWHVEGFVLLRIAHQYGSTRLARDHWSGPVLFGTGSDRFETRSTATHPERDIISRASSLCGTAEESVDNLCMVAVC